MSIYQAFKRTPEVDYKNNGGAEGGPKVVDMPLTEMNLIIEELYGPDAANDTNFFTGSSVVSDALLRISNKFAQAA